MEPHTFLKVWNYEVHRRNPGDLHEGKRFQQQTVRGVSITNYSVPVKAEAIYHFTSWHWEPRGKPFKFFVKM